MNIQSLKIIRKNSDYLNYMFNKMEKKLILNMEDNIVFCKDINININKIKKELNSKNIDYTNIF